LTGTVTGVAGATIYAGARPADTPLVKRGNFVDEPGPFAPLALFVEADNNNFTRNPEHHLVVDGITLAFDTDSSTSHELKTITCNSAVVTPPGQTPELVAGPNGNVAKATDVTVNGVTDPAAGTHVINAAGNIVVGDIANSGSPGDVIFQALGG